VLRRIFGSKRDEVAGRWWKLHDEGLHSLYSSPNIVRLIKSRMPRWVGKRPLRRPSRRWEDNIKMDISKRQLGSAEWIHMAQDRDWCKALAKTIMRVEFLAT
jgi:hypothetical protein